MLKVRCKTEVVTLPCKRYDPVLQKWLDREHKWEVDLTIPKEKMIKKILKDLKRCKCRPQEQLNELTEAIYSEAIHLKRQRVEKLMQQHAEITEQMRKGEQTTNEELVKQFYITKLRLPKHYFIKKIPVEVPENTEEVTVECFTRIVPQDVKRLCQSFKTYRHVSGDLKLGVSIYYIPNEKAIQYFVEKHSDMLDKRKKTQVKQLLKKAIDIEETIARIVSWINKDYNLIQGL